MIVINFFGAPGSGKSTATAKLFARLKERQCNAELVSEYAKQLTWDERFNTLSDQIYVFAKQQRALNRLYGKVDYVVNDGPLIQSIPYKQQSLSETFDKLVLEEFNKHTNINILLERDVKYSTDGRNQTEAEAKEFAKRIEKLLDDSKQSYYRIYTSHFNIEMEHIVDTAISKHSLSKFDISKVFKLDSPTYTPKVVMTVDKFFANASSDVYFDERK